jgi:hypothetical protein
VEFKSRGVFFYKDKFLTQYFRFHLHKCKSTCHHFSFSPSARWCMGNHLISVSCITILNQLLQTCRHSGGRQIASLDRQLLDPVCSWSNTPTPGFPLYSASAHFSVITPYHLTHRVIKHVVVLPTLLFRTCIDIPIRYPKFSRRISSRGMLPMYFCRSTAGIGVKFHFYRPWPLL